jgi:hypothetical protein
LYATVCLLDEPERWRVWGLVAGVALAASATLRSAASLIIPVAGLAVVLFRPTESSSWRTQWRAALALIASAAVVLVIFAGASASNGQGFRLAPSPGWYLYGRVAQFADCHRFTPPPGTAALCENTPLSQRRSAYFYMFDSHAPAQRLFGGFGRDDAVIGGWARRALSAQFGDFVSTAWTYLRSYYVPGSRPARLRSSTELDPQLDFSNQGNVFYDAAGHQALEDFFVPFSVHQQSWAQRVIRRWQVIFRFGATALFITTVLVLIGLIVGTRRSRIGVMLFGVGGLSLLLPPVLTSTYSGRYTVPLAAPLVAAAAITITQLWRMQRARARVNTAEGSAVRA